MRTWIKFYTKINHDPDAGSLTWAHRGIWSALLALCGEIDCQNGDGSQTGELDTQERTAWRIRCDPDAFNEALSEFAEREWIETRDDVLYILNYPRLQAKPPSQTREAIRERVAAYRERNEDVTRLHQGVTPSESEAESDTDTDTESDKSQTQSQSGVVTPHPPLAASSSDLSDSNSSSGPDPPGYGGRIQRCIDLREDREGPLSSRELTQMGDWFKKHGTSAVWGALQKAVANNAANIGGYMRTVLEKQQTRGP